MSTLSEGLTKLVESELITKEWAEACPEAFQYFYDKIGPFLKDKEYYPESGKIFRALNECSPEALKVVILGQDPYHDGSATGLCFDNVRGTRKISPSLRKILQELVDDIGCRSIGPVRDDMFDVQGDGWLRHLPVQGVLLLNTALTVEEHKAGSHTKLWEPFTNQLIKDLNTKDDIVWILWGNHAKAYKELVTNKTHYIIEGGHPSPLNTSVPFAGGKYFSECNSFLKTVNKSPIQW